MDYYSAMKSNEYTSIKTSVVRWEICLQHISKKKTYGKLYRNIHIKHLKDKKSNETLIDVTMWTNVETIMLSERNQQTQRLHLE